MVFELWAEEVVYQSFLASKQSSLVNIPPNNSFFLLKLNIGHNMMKSIEDAPNHLPPSVTSFSVDHNDIQVLFTPIIALLC